MKSILTTMFVALLLFTACSKNTKQTPPDNNLEDTVQLTDQEKELIGTWIRYKIIDTSYSDYSKEYTIKEMTDPCSLNDEYTFKADKTYFIQPGKDSIACRKKSANGYDWSIANNYLTYMDGPSLHGEGGNYTKIDGNHFAVQGYNPHTYGWGKKTYYFKRK